MPKITDELLKTHRVVRKVLEGLDGESKRFPEVMKTLHRTLLAHAWFQDEILLPAIREKSMIEMPFLNEITQEHKDLDRLLKSLLDTSLDLKPKLEAELLQIRTLIEMHFRKEAEALYPLAEKVLDIQELSALGDEMGRHQPEIREVAWN